MARKGIRKGAQGLFGGVLGKVPLRNVPDFRAPADIRRVLVQNIENLRENAVEVFSKEISKVLSRVDARKIVDEVLRNYSLQVNARIDLVPKRRGGGRKARR